MGWLDNLDRVTVRHRELADRLSAGALDSAELQELSREYAELTPLAEKAHAYSAALGEEADLTALAADPEQGAEMRALAQTELDTLHDRLQGLREELQLLLLPEDKADRRGVILEIRAGAGGDEAALFAADLFRMYQRFAQISNWRMEVLECSENDLGGFGQVVAGIEGRGVFGQLKYESGVHRVQRIPVTESGGRIHTSTATVAVLPQAEEVEIAIDDKDLRIDTHRSQGAGGQHVNTTDSAVRITHLPTGLVVTCQDEKSQHKNRARAMKVLRARLFDRERARREEARAVARRQQIGTGDRSERIRTYNFPQGRMSDHRIGLTLYKLDRIISGEGLGEVVEALTLEDRALRLARFDDDGDDRDDKGCDAA